MKTLFTTLCLFAVYAITGQNIDRQVIASSGSTFNNPSSKLTFTIGEPIIGYLTNVTTVSQGFLAILEDENSLSNDKMAAKNNIKLYPNPVTEHLSIDLNNINGSVKLKIYDISGKLLQDAMIKRNENTINLSHLPNGSYVIRLEMIDTNKHYSFKIIKK